MNKNMRELIETINFEEANLPQSQDSVYDQLVELHSLANKNGLYDAADVLSDVMSRMFPQFWRR